MATGGENRRLALFPASFDPITNGHLDLIERSRAIFDDVVLGVARNVSKRAVFSGDERLATAVEVTRNHFFLSGMGDAAENIPPHRALPDAVRRTNHFIGREIAKTQPRRSENYHPKNYREGTWLRYQRITEYLEAHRGTLDAPSMVALLRRYPPGHPCLHQAVMCPTDRIIWVSQAVDDRTSKTAGAQNQTFHAYRLTRNGIFPAGTLSPEAPTRRTSSARR